MIILCSVYESNIYIFSTRGVICISIKLHWFEIRTSMLFYLHNLSYMFYLWTIMYVTASRHYIIDLYHYFMSTCVYMWGCRYIISGQQHDIKVEIIKYGERHSTWVIYMSVCSAVVGSVTAAFNIVRTLYRSRPENTKM